MAPIVDYQHNMQQRNSVVKEIVSIEAEDNMNTIFEYMYLCTIQQ